MQEASNSVDESKAIQQPVEWLPLTELRSSPEAPLASCHPSPKGSLANSEVKLCIPSLVDEAIYQPVKKPVPVSDLVDVPDKPCATIQASKVLLEQEQVASVPSSVDNAAMTAPSGSIDDSNDHLYECVTYAEGRQMSSAAIAPTTPIDSPNDCTLVCCKRCGRCLGRCLPTTKGYFIIIPALFLLMVFAFFLYKYFRMRYIPA